MLDRCLRECLYDRLERSPGRVSWGSSIAKGDDARDPAPPVRKGWVLAILSLSTFLIFLDGTVVNTALPAIARDFSASNASLQWVVNAYSLILAGMLLVGGTIGDRFGRRRALATGMLIFGAGALGAALADSSATLIVMRGVQGLGAAFALPATLSIITAVFPRGERAKAIATWTAVGSLGIVIGPALGGYLVDAVDWSAVFWLHVPVVALAIAGLGLVPESRDSRRLPIDVPGAVLATTGMLAVVFAVMQGGEEGWTSPSILIAGGVGVVLLGLFALVELRSTHPMLPLAYFKRRDLTGSFTVLIAAVRRHGRRLLLPHAVLPARAGPLGAGRRACDHACGGDDDDRRGHRRQGRRPGGPTRADDHGLADRPGGHGRLQPDRRRHGVLGAGARHLDLRPWCRHRDADGDRHDHGRRAVDDAGMGSAMNDLSRELGIVGGIAILGSLVANLYRSDVKPAVDGLVPTDAAERISDSFGAVGAQTAELPQPWRRRSTSPRIDRSSTPSASATWRRLGSSWSP